MTNTKHSFRATNNTEFIQVLKQRVNEYFSMSKVSRKGNVSLLLKTILVFSLYFLPYFILISGVVSGAGAIIALWVLMSFGMAGIGMCVMHDANHNSYSVHAGTNKLLSLSLNMIGGNHEIWKIQHNVLHHTYTNIYGADDDLNAPGILRLTPDAPLKKIHRFQFIYAYFLYCLSTITRIGFKEFIQVNRFKKAGLLKQSGTYRSFLGKMIAWKIFYFSYMLIIPILLIPSPVWFTVLCFLLMHAIAGFILTMIFQTAHIVPDVDFPMPSTEGVIEEQWVIHEMQTTSNFSPKSRIFSWLIGGLNYQVEHHLFPNISHIHYRKLSPIVAQTAQEFGIPYNVQGNFLIASLNHVNMLYKLGRKSK